MLFYKNLGQRYLNILLGVRFISRHQLVEAQITKFNCSKDILKVVHVRLQFKLHVQNGILIALAL